MAKEPIHIDWTIVDRELAGMAEGTEIAALLGVSDKTLYRACKREKGQKWQNYAARHYASTRQLLRRRQIDRAMGYQRIESVPFNTATGVVFHDVTRQVEPSDMMLKWLGTQYLGQKDKQDVMMQIPDFVVVGDGIDNMDDDE